MASDLASPTSQNSQHFDAIACTRCACVCDDLQVTVQNERIVAAERACHLARDWYLRQNVVSRPIAEHQGRPVELDVAIQHAADILSSARYPLIYGLSGSSTDGQRAAVSLSDTLGATIDSTASEGHAPSLMALQQSGESTCSLGEIRHRADLVIFWGADPETTHPRHLERYSAFPRGDQLPRGRADRTLIVIDHEGNAPNQTALQADFSYTLPPEHDFAALWTLRLLLQGKAPRPGAETGLPLPVLEELCERMKNCRCGVIFFGYGIARQVQGHHTVEALLRLVIDLNAHTRFYARRLRMIGDVAGADNVLCWQTGYPFAVNLSRGYPRYSPGEFSAAEMLSRQEPDAAVLIGSDRIATFPESAQAHLRRIPTILLDAPSVEIAWTPTLRFSTATYGVHLPGTAYRMDDVPIPLRAILPTVFPSDSKVLRTIEAAVAQRRFRERSEISR